MREEAAEALAQSDKFGLGSCSAVEGVSLHMAVRNASVPIEDAAGAAGVDVEQIRRWAAIDGLRIQGRGGREFVLLDQVMSLAIAARRRDPSSARGALRARLADARIQNPSVSGLQRSVRDRGV